ncbi:MAG: DUF29 domain-containing protein [Cyanosarcina radialis HA8281-LM2]|nr:DUF29 domain-containing protein [Cyanosarcina radialis HA8281-LM2]
MEATVKQLKTRQSDELGWQDTIREQRRQIKLLLADSPSVQRISEKLKSLHSFAQRALCALPPSPP